MRKLLRIILDIVFPLSVHGKLLTTLSPEQFSKYYIEIRLPNCISLSTYHTPEVQAAVAACKFENNHHAATLLASLLAHFLTHHPHEGSTLLIPIPLSQKREKERGFNQVSRVLSYVPKKVTNSIVLEDLLRRTKDTLRQTSLNRSDRLNNMKGAMIATSELVYLDWTGVSRVIICDDVLTTGATLSAAKAALTPHLPAHVSLICIAWAH